MCTTGNEELVTFDIIPNTNNKYDFEEQFLNKMQLFDDPNFYKELKTIQQYSNNSGLIPSDLAKIIKNINENSSYFENVQFNEKTSKKEDFLCLIQEELKNLREQVETNRSYLVSTVIKIYVYIIFKLAFLEIP